MENDDFGEDWSIRSDFLALYEHHPRFVKTLVTDRIIYLTYAKVTSGWEEPMRIISFYTDDDQRSGEI